MIVYLYSLLGFEGFSLTIIECLLFGSTLSATDPVTILAIFNALHVDPKLYSVIFGESILNDAVAIVMFEYACPCALRLLMLLQDALPVPRREDPRPFLLSRGGHLPAHLLHLDGPGCHFWPGLLSHAEALGARCVSLRRRPSLTSCRSILRDRELLGVPHRVHVLLLLERFYNVRCVSWRCIRALLTRAGIVSLLFCGITLKHYAYHNMSHRTQRTSRYMFGMLAQLSENFIFIYLGLSLFTQTQLVYKPMFILVTAVSLTFIASALTGQMAVCVARYCAVFPISKVINLYFRARGQRSDELPHSYQMMLFWAGLRGAVGVALAAGMKGENAVALRTTVLVTVVLTVVVFGGTIGRMIEILGIRTGVEEDNEDSSEDEGNVYGMVGDGEESARPSKKSKRRSLGNGIPGGKYSLNPVEHDRDESSNFSEVQRFRDSRAISDTSSRTVVGGHSSPLPQSPSVNRLMSPTSELSSSEDSDSEVLPNASTEEGVEKEGDLTRVWRDGQWFTVLDERYLLPVFSNATASRRQASRKALKAKRTSFAGERDELFDTEVGPSGSAPTSPYLLSPATGPGFVPGQKRREFNGSFSDIFSSLVGPALSSTPSSTPPPPPPFKRKGSIETADDSEHTIDLNLTSLGNRRRASPPHTPTSGSLSSTTTSSVDRSSTGTGPPALAFNAPASSLGSTSSLSGTGAGKRNSIGKGEGGGR